MVSLPADVNEWTNLRTGSDTRCRSTGEPIDEVDDARLMRAVALGRMSPARGGSAQEAVRLLLYAGVVTVSRGLGPSQWRPSIRFGFILAESQEYFFHRSDVTGGSFEDLKDGDTVEFDVGESPKGPRAERIRKK